MERCALIGMVVWAKQLKYVKSSLLSTRVFDYYTLTKKTFCSCCKSVLHMKTSQSAGHNIVVYKLKYKLMTNVLTHGDWGGDAVVSASASKWVDFGFNSFIESHQ